jgi:hypothetical protein
MSKRMVRFSVKVESNLIDGNWSFSDCLLSILIQFYQFITPLRNNDIPTTCFPPHLSAIIPPKICVARYLQVHCTKLGGNEWVQSSLTHRRIHPESETLQSCSMEINCRWSDAIFNVHFLDNHKMNQLTCWIFELLLLLSTIPMILIERFVLIIYEMKHAKNIQTPTLKRVGTFAEKFTKQFFTLVQMIIVFNYF